MPADIDFLGEFLVRNFRNTAIACAEGLCRENFDSPGHREYQVMLRALSADQKIILQKVVKYCVEGALNDTISHLDAELNKKKARIQILIDGEPLASSETPSRLHLNLWGAEGWISRYQGSGGK